MKILTLAASPQQSAHLRLMDEIRDMKAGLRSARYGELFELLPELAVRPADLQASMIRERPQFVHFCGHGSSAGELILVNDQGRPHPVRPDALADLFSICHFVDCVVLNACYAEIQARAIAEHIPYVVGMSKAISDRAAILFAVAFYSAIGAGESVENAYKLGCNRLRLENISEPLTPVLIVGFRTMTRYSRIRQMSQQEVNSVIQQYQMMLAAGRQDGDCHFGLGLLYLHAGLYDLSLQHLQKAVDLKPGHAEALYYKAMALLRGRKPRTLDFQTVRTIESCLVAALQFDDRPAKYYLFLGALRREYYLRHGLSSPAPSPGELFAIAKGKEPDSWEIDRLLALVPFEGGLRDLKQNEIL